MSIAALEEIAALRRSLAEIDGPADDLAERAAATARSLRDLLARAGALSEAAEPRTGTEG